MSFQKCYQDDDPNPDDIIMVVLGGDFPRFVARSFFSSIACGQSTRPMGKKTKNHTIMGLIWGKQDRKVGGKTRMTPQKDRLQAALPCTWEWFGAPVAPDHVAMLVLVEVARAARCLGTPQKCWGQQAFWISLGRTDGWRVSGQPRCHGRRCQSVGRDGERRPGPTHQATASNGADDAQNKPEAPIQRGTGSSSPEYGYATWRMSGMRLKLIHVVVVVVSRKPRTLILKSGDFITAEDSIPILTGYCTTVHRYHRQDRLQFSLILIKGLTAKGQEHVRATIQPTTLRTQP
ncbi:hypothetical protein B0T13DRAFT_503347 [Neurospora crassa]|nr:hypothetical protein B0T13DRAFT_503347 [Neurospora crassa]